MSITKIFIEVFEHLFGDLKLIEIYNKIKRIKD